MTFPSSRIACDDNRDRNSAAPFIWTALSLVRVVACMLLRKQHILASTDPTRWLNVECLRYNPGMQDRRMKLSGFEQAVSTLFVMNMDQPHVLAIPSELPALSTVVVTTTVLYHLQQSSAVLLMSHLPLSSFRASPLAPSR